MRKLILVLVLLFVISSAQAITIYEYLDDLVESDNENDVVIVIGDEAFSSDVIAAQTIIAEFQKITKVKGLLDYKLSSEVNREINLILLGNPCENKKIKDLGLLECFSSLYKEGGAYIKVSWTNLLIAGATQKDTRFAANIIANYKDYQSLLDKEEIIIDSSLGIEASGDAECGDGVCDSGENLFCSTDCVGHISCERYCLSQEFLSGRCRGPSENGFCLENEELFGFEYCDGAQRCCCEREVSSDKPTIIPRGEGLNYDEELAPTLIEKIRGQLIFWAVILGIFIIILVLIFILKSYFNKKRRKEEESPILDE